MKKTMMVAALACTTLVAGCDGDKGGADGKGASEPAAAAGGMPTSWKATDACSIVTSADMAEVMKSEVSEATVALVSEAEGDNAATSECTYLFKDGGRATVMARWSPINDNNEVAISTARTTVAETVKAFTDRPVEDVAGLGKAAFFVPKINQLNVFLDDARMVMITISSAPDATAKDQAVAIARKAM
jgi:hypothetical protein